MNPSYLARNLEELYENAPSDIVKLIENGEVDSTTAVLGKIYKLPIASYVALSNVITFILIGALSPENVTRALVDIVGVTQDDAVNMASDLDKSILEKARIKIMGKPATEMVELTFQEGRSADDLRKEIMDTTKRESALVKEQSSASKAETPTQDSSVQTSPQLAVQTGTVTPTDQQPTSAPVVPTEAATIATASVGGQGVAAGSRTQLLEQLQVLDNIPDDEEVSERLAKIREQIAEITGQQEEPAAPTAPLHNYILGDKADQMVEPDVKPATYSKAPTKYNVDPYRETVED